MCVFKTTQCNSLHTCPWYGNVGWTLRALEASSSSCLTPEVSSLLKKKKKHTVGRGEGERGGVPEPPPSPNPSSWQAWSPFADTDSALLFVWIENPHSASRPKPIARFHQPKKSLWKVWYRLRGVQVFSFFFFFFVSWVGERHSYGEEYLCVCTQRERTYS